MAGGCCCMKSQNAVYITSGILIVGWAVQLIFSVDRFISAVQWSKEFPHERDEDGGTRVGVSGLLVIVDSSQTALSALLLSATFLRDLNKLQPWFILTGVATIIYVPLSTAACILNVTTPLEFVLSWFLLILVLYSFWLVYEFKKEFSSSSMERLL